MLNVLISNNFIFIHVPRTAGTGIQYAITDVIKYPRRVHKGRDLIHPDHITLTKLQNRNTFSFAFVRNPWDWARSMYHYTIKYGHNRQWKSEIQKYKNQGLNDWVCEDMINWIKTFTRWHHNNTIHQQHTWTRGVSYIGRFENLKEDFEHVCESLNIKPTLPHKMESTIGHYQDEYNDLGRKKIQNLFSQDIEQFKYTF